jgi:DNA-binding MarR family transcriptional regulator
MFFNEITVRVFLKLRKHQTNKSLSLATGIAYSNISKHLTRFRKMNLIKEKEIVLKNGRTRNYVLTDKGLQLEEYLLKIKGLVK